MHFTKKKLQKTINLQLQITILKNNKIKILEHYRVFARNSFVFHVYYWFLRRQFNCKSLFDMNGETLVGKRCDCWIVCSRVVLSVTITRHITMNNDCHRDGLEDNSTVNRMSLFSAPFEEIDFPKLNSLVIPSLALLERTYRMIDMECFVNPNEYRISILSPILWKCDHWSLK